jgi:hypothetical protein
MLQAAFSEAKKIRMDRVDDVHDDAPRWKVYLWRDVFENMQVIQKSQNESPKFDLRDLTCAALNLVLKMPDSREQILQQAKLDFASRMKCD